MKTLAATIAVALSLGATAAGAQNTALAPAEEAKPVPVVPAPVLGPISDFNAVGDLSANALIGITVKNADKESVGKVEDVYVSQNGQIKSVVLSSGGVLGIGARYLLVSWNDLKFQREGDSLAVTIAASKDTLKSMPPYSFERRPVRN